MPKVKRNERHKRMANLTAEIQHVAPSSEGPLQLTLQCSVHGDVTLIHGDAEAL